jgi:Haem-dependent oxidative N-demethylase, alpha subunit-like
MSEIVQERLPVAPWMAEHTLRLPGTVPIAPEDWLQRDEVFAAQMAARDRLIAERRDAVHAMAESARPAAEELLATILDRLSAAEGYAREAGGMRRPDGVLVPLDGPPMVAAGRLVQEDLVVLEKAEGDAEHRLTAALLCFPSNWTLAQKFGMPLTRIHLPVESYDAGVAKRVQRLFDMVRPEAPLMRANLIPYSHGDLHSPRPEFDRHDPGAGAVNFVRVERQTLVRLPETRAVIFSIHVYQVPLAAITGPERARLEAVRPGWFVPATV